MSSHNMVDLSVVRLSFRTSYIKPKCCFVCFLPNIIKKCLVINSKKMDLKLID